MNTHHPDSRGGKAITNKRQLIDRETVYTDMLADVVSDDYYHVMNSDGTVETFHESDYEDMKEAGLITEDDSDKHFMGVEPIWPEPEPKKTMMDRVRGIFGR